MMNPSLGAALRAARKDVGLTENDAATRANVERGWLNAVELGRINKPDPDKLKRLATLYAVHPSVFLRLAGYDVDMTTMPRRNLSDLALELYTQLREAERTL